MDDGTARENNGRHEANIEAEPGDKGADSGKRYPLAVKREAFAGDGVADQPARDAIQAAIIAARAVGASVKRDRDAARAMIEAVAAEQIADSVKREGVGSANLAVRA